MDSQQHDGDITDGYCLPDDIPEVFQLLHTWLYTSKLKPVAYVYKDVGNSFVKDHVASTDPYFDLYYMAEARQLRDLQNLATDRIREYYAKEETNSGWQRCSRVYQGTSPGSPIRALVLALVLSR